MMTDVPIFDKLQKNHMVFRLICSDLFLNMFDTDKKYQEALLFLLRIIAFFLSHASFNGERLNEAK